MTIDAAHAALHEFRSFVGEANFTSARTGPDSKTVYSFKDGTFLRALNDALLAKKVRLFLKRSAQLTESLADKGRLASGPAGPSVDGVGLERILIAYELAWRYGEQDHNEWVSGLSDFCNDISHLLSFFSQMAQRRYEKTTAQMTVAYYPTTARGSRYGQLGKPLLDQYKALLRLCRDAHTVLVVRTGNIISDLLVRPAGVSSDQDDFNLPPVLPRLAHLRDLPLEDGVSPIVFNLNTNGSMEVVAKSELAFRRVNNVWRFTNLGGALEAIKSKLSDVSNDNPTLVAYNFLSLALDLADRGEGALLFLCDEPTTAVLDQLLDSQDGLIREEPGLPYQELSARMRLTQLVGQKQLSLQKGTYRYLSALLRDVCSIDGATIFTYRGDLIGFGCIARPRPTSDKSGARHEGARSAAAKAISQRGIAIKVSTDGDATLYLHGETWGTFC